jgi:hypothetical protein
MVSFLRVADRPFPTLPQDCRSRKNTILFRDAHLATNAARTCEPLPNGTLIKSAPPAAPDDSPEPRVNPGRRSVLPSDVGGQR